MKHLDVVIKRVKLIAWASFGVALMQYFILDKSFAEMADFFNNVSIPLVNLFVAWFLVSHWVYQFKRGKRGGGISHGNTDIKGALYHAYKDNSSW